MMNRSLAAEVLRRLDPAAPWIDPLATALEAALKAGQSAMPLRDLSQPPDLDHALISGEDAIFGVVGERIGFRRFVHMEQQIASQLLARAQQRLHPSPQTDSCDTGGAPDDGADAAQAKAVAMAQQQALLLLCGGPGTGKTYTLAKIVGALDRRGRLGRLALAAPTGKAAMRLAAALGEDDQRHKAQTLHALLGLRPYSSARFNRARPLPFDTLIVDEASMLGSAMLHQLLDALAPGARLILCGDPAQLPPVDIGSPWRSIVEADALEANRVLLQTRHRFNDAIGGLADAINHGQNPLPISAEIPLYDDFEPQIDALIQRSAEACQHPERQQAFKLLCAQRNGRWGSQHFNQLLHRALSPRNTMIDGQPIIINQNAPRVGLYNGDTGYLKFHNKAWHAHFHGSNSPPLPVSELPSFENAYALSVHRAQGSEYQELWLSLLGADRKLLNRALLYTGVTRAKQHLSLFADPAALAQALASQQQSQDFLADFLAAQAAHGT